MQMTALRLATPDIDAQRTFYTETLGLSLVQASDVAFTVRIGDTQLTFQAT
ncbi:MAG: VOC family protein, partial [Ktedonobacteraceae bacterium]|nr:VOC family protein [Ktedonobacteraceae bacterium]